MTEPFRLPLEKRVLGPILSEKARTEGDRPYLTCGERTWSFRETDRDVRALGRGLRERGVAPRDAMAVMLPNCAEFVFSWYACVIVGAIFVPMNPTYTGALLEYVLADSSAKSLIVHRDLAPQLASIPREVIERLDWIAVVGGAHGLGLPQGVVRFIDYDSIAIQEGDDPEEPATFRDTQSIMYTSGTTGPSKGVIIPNGHFFASSGAFLRATGLNRDDVLFTPLPLFHGVASRLGVLPALMVGARVVIAEKFSAKQFWNEVIACGATVGHTIFSIPPILKAQPPSDLDKAHRLRAMYNAHYDAEFEERFNVHLVEAYGLTETGVNIHTDWPHRRTGSCGTVNEDWEVQLIDESGLPVPDGEVGEVVSRPKLPSIMMDGYVNKPEETLKTLRNLWFHSGDYAKRDADGYFYFTGRKKERIRRRGENISGFEVEQIVGRHPDISEVAALGHPAGDGEDDVRCVIIRREGSTLTPVELMDWLQPRMPFFMLPRYVEFTDVMPRTPSAKVEKYKLVEMGLGPTAWDRESAGYRIERNRKPEAQRKAS